MSFHVCGKHCLSTFHTLTHSLLTPELQGRYSYYPHLMDEETEEQ